MHESLMILCGSRLVLFMSANLNEILTDCFVSFSQEIFPEGLLCEGHNGLGRVCQEYFPFVYFVKCNHLFS